MISRKVFRAISIELVSITYLIVYFVISNLLQDGLDVWVAKEKQQHSSPMKMAPSSKCKCISSNAIIQANSLSRVANVILQSGSTVPDWITKLPKPSKMKRRAMGKIKRADTVSNAHRIGRGDAIKKR